MKRVVVGMLMVAVCAVCLVGCGKTKDKGKDGEDLKVESVDSGEESEGGEEADGESEADVDSLLPPEGAEDILAIDPVHISVMLNGEKVELPGVGSSLAEWQELGLLGTTKISAYNSERIWEEEYDKCKDNTDTVSLTVDLGGADTGFELSAVFEAKVDGSAWKDYTLYSCIVAGSEGVGVADGKITAESTPQQVFEELGTTVWYDTNSSMEYEFQEGDIKSSLMFYWADNTEISTVCVSRLSE